MSNPIWKRALPALVFLLGSCISAEQQDHKTATEPWVGTFVSEGYFRRDEGADWGMIRIDSALYVQLRSRADLTPALCDYDFIAEDPKPIEDGIDLGFATLRMDTIELEPNQWLCDDRVAPAQRFIRLNEPLDERQLIYVLHNSPVEEESQGAFAVREVERKLLVRGRAGRTDTIPLHDRYVRDHFASDINADGTPELVIALNRFTLLDRQPCQPELLVYAQASNGHITPIPVEDFLQTPHSHRLGNLFWIQTSSAKLKLNFPLTNHEQVQIDSLRIIEYKMIDSGSGKKLIIGKVTEEWDGNCYY